MSRKTRKPERHPVDGVEMTVPEIADMLGITAAALYTRRSKLGGVSYQAIVDMYRANMFGNTHDRSPRYLVDGQWMSLREIAEMLGIKLHSLVNWRNVHPDATLHDAIDWFRGYQTGARKRGHGKQGRPPTLYRVGRKTYSVPQVARMFGVRTSSVRRQLKQRDGDMAATLRHYQEREARRKRKAEKEILGILGF